MITREQIEQHARSGRKIQAIKDYRELTRSGLAESKSAVEDFIAYGRWGAQTPFAAAAAPPAAAARPAPAAAPSTPPSLTRSALAEVEALARANKKIDAIKALRGHLALGLKDAKDAVEHFIARGTWPDLDGASAPSRSDPAPTPPPSTAPRATPPITDKADPARAPAEALEALRQRIGAAPVDAIYPVEKDLTRGLLALSGQGAFFLADRFGRWQLDREYLRTEGIRAQVRRGFTAIELRLEKSFIYDLITGLDEAAARRVARFIDPEYTDTSV